MRTADRSKRLFAALAASLAVALGSTAAAADDDHRGWHHKHWKKHHHQEHHHGHGHGRLVVIERPAYFHAPAPAIVVVEPIYHHPAPVYVAPGDRFFFSMSWN